MAPALSDRRPVAGVGVVCVRRDHVLLVKRRWPPMAGEWSIPGGKLEFGERAADAALRELFEETGVRAEIVGLVDVVDAIDAGAERHFVLIDFAARWIEGEPRAGDDAAEARFVSLPWALERVRWSETRRILTLGSGLVSAPAAP